MVQGQEVVDAAWTEINGYEAGRRKVNEKGTFGLMHKRFP